MRRLLIVSTLSFAVPALLCAAAQAASPIPGAYEVAQAPTGVQGTPPDDEKSQDKKQGDDKGRREGGRQGGGKPQQDGQGAQQRRDGGGERGRRRDDAQQRQQQQKPQGNPQAQQQQQRKPQDNPQAQQQQRKPQDNPQAQQPSGQKPNQAQDNRKEDRRQGERRDDDRKKVPTWMKPAQQPRDKAPANAGQPQGQPQQNQQGQQRQEGPREGRNDNAGAGAPGGPQGQPGQREGRPNDRDRDPRPGRGDQAGPGGQKGPPPQAQKPGGQGPGPRDNAGPPPRSGNEPPRQDARRDDRRPGGRGSIDEIKRGRRERVEDGGRRKIIEEPGNRTIVQQKGQPPMIRHDEGDRMRRTSRDVRRERRPDGGSLTIAIRPGGIEVYSEFDNSGRLMRRYRRDRNGREWNLIDNRRFRGAPIFLDLSPPRLRMPRDRYIMDYERASDDDLYDALMDGPVDELDRAYSLDEIRYNAYLRDRMRRVDLDTVTFDFGAWQVPYDQYGRLERIARIINRILDRRPDEVLLIEGHTDAVGSDLDNLTLSDRRAEEVAVILTETFGVPPENLVTQGYGEEFLKVPTSGPERANRRVSVRRITPLMARRR